MKKTKASDNEVNTAEIIDSTDNNFYYKMLLIRRFEEKILELFSQGKLYGTTHAYIGQEANAVGVLSNIKQNDKVFTNHRCHGHYLTRTDDIVGLMGELMGKSIGICSGIGGSQHIYKNGFYSNGIQGSFMPIIVGMALAEKQQKSKNIVVGFIGDGTLGEGVVYEALNLMSLLKVPVLLVIENNRYAQSTPIEVNLAGSISKRIEAFDINVTELDTTYVIEIHETSKKLVNKIRTECIPKVLLLNTYRFCPHSKGDEIRSENEIKRYKLKDPLKRFEGIISEDKIEKMKKDIDARLAEAEELCNKSSFYDLKEEKCVTQNP